MRSSSSRLKSPVLIPENYCHTVLSWPQETGPYKRHGQETWRFIQKIFHTWPPRISDLNPCCVGYLKSQVYHDHPTLLWILKDNIRRQFLRFLKICCTMLFRTLSTKGNVPGWQSSWWSKNTVFAEKQLC